MDMVISRHQIVEDRSYEFIELLIKNISLFYKTHLQNLSLFRLLSRSELRDRCRLRP